MFAKKIVCCHAIFNFFSMNRLAYLTLLINFPFYRYSRLNQQCDQLKVAKCLQKLPKNDFTRKLIDFSNFTKIA